MGWHSQDSALKSKENHELLLHRDSDSVHCQAGVQKQEYFGDDVERCDGLPPWELSIALARSSYQLVNSGYVPNCYIEHC